MTQLLLGPLGAQLGSLWEHRQVESWDHWDTVPQREMLTGSGLEAESSSPLPTFLSQNFFLVSSRYLAESNWRQTGRGI